MNDADKIMHYEELFRRLAIHGIPENRVRPTIEHYLSLHPELFDGKPWKSFLTN